MQEELICPKCERPVGARYREKPKGEKAEFWCIDCINKENAVSMIPRPKRKKDSEIDLCNKCPYGHTKAKDNWKKAKLFLDIETINLIENSTLEDLQPKRRNSYEEYKAR